MAKNDYVINSKLEEIISKYQDVKAKLIKSKGKKKEKLLVEQKEVQSDLAKLFYEMAEGILTKYNFKLVNRDDAIQEGVFISLQKADKFDHNYIGIKGKSKAFNYITTCILNHFRQLHRAEKSKSELLSRYTLHMADKMDQKFREQGIRLPKRYNDFNKDDEK